MNAIDYVTHIEEEGLQLFELLGFDAPNQELKNTYNLLANSQRRHLASLLAMKTETAATRSESALLERTKCLSNGFERLLDSRDIMHELKNDPDAFWHVVRTEEECIKLMEGMAHAEKETASRKLLDRLIAGEKDHLENIENIYAFVTAPHTFLEWGEFSNLQRL